MKKTTGVILLAVLERLMCHGEIARNKVDIMGIKIIFFIIFSLLTNSLERRQKIGIVKKPKNAKGNLIEKTFKSNKSTEGIEK